MNASLMTYAKAGAAGYAAKQVYEGGKEFATGQPKRALNRFTRLGIEAAAGGVAIYSARARTPAGGARQGRMFNTSQYRRRR